MDLLGIAARFPTFAANPVGAVLLSKNFWKSLAILAIFAGIAGGIWYTVNKIETLSKANADLSHELSLKADEIKTLQTSIVETNNYIIRVDAAAQTANAGVRDLRKRLFSGDIGKDAVANPVKIEAEINTVARERARCVQLATGSPVKPEDGENALCAQLVKQLQSRSQPSP